MNKRAQEGVTLTTLLLIILGVVVVAVIILGATGVFGDIFSWLDNAPNLEVVAQACGTSGSAGLLADYCREFREVEIDGVNQFATCSSQTVEALIDSDSRIASQCISSDLAPGSVAEQFCLNSVTSGKVKASRWDETLVNGQTCLARLGFDVNDLDGAGCSSTLDLGTGYGLINEESCSAGDIDVTGITGSESGRCCLYKVG